MNNSNLDEALMAAVTERDVKKAEQLLKSGANPNYHVPEHEYQGMAEYKYQPYTPLRMVVHILSDAMAEDDDSKRNHEMARLLLDHGADPVSALDLFKNRYGHFDSTLDDHPYAPVYTALKSAADNREKDQ